MPNIYLDYSLKCINSKPTKGKAPQLEGTFVRREFSLKIELISQIFSAFLAIDDSHLQHRLQFYSHNLVNNEVHPT